MNGRRAKWLRREAAMAMDALGMVSTRRVRPGRVHGNQAGPNPFRRIRTQGELDAARARGDVVVQKR